MAMAAISARYIASLVEERLKAIVEERRFEREDHVKYRTNMLLAKAKLQSELSAKIYTCDRRLDERWFCYQAKNRVLEDEHYNFVYVYVCTCYSTQLQVVVCSCKSVSCMQVSHLTRTKSRFC